MRVFLLIAAVGLVSSSPALATGGFSCSTTGFPGLTLQIVTGTGQPGGIVAATLSGNGKLLSTHDDGADPWVIGQSWIDAQLLLVDFLDPEGKRRIARLRARLVSQVLGIAPGMSPPPPMLEGTLKVQGSTHPVRCTLEQ